jgi:hypothetical protein
MSKVRVPYNEVQVVDSEYCPAHAELAGLKGSL